MSKQKMKDAGPDSQRRVPRFDGSDEDVEGHARPHTVRDGAGPEGQKNKAKFEGGDEDDVEGHRKPLPR